MSEKIKKMAEKYGDVTFEGTRYILTDYADFEQCSNEYYPRMVAPAIDEAEDEYLVFFRVKDEYVVRKYDGRNWTYDIIDDCGNDYSDLCDWDEVDEIQEL